MENAPSLVNLHQFQDGMVAASNFLDCVAMEQRQRLDWLMEQWVEEARYVDKYERCEEER